MGPTPSKPWHTPRRKHKDPAVDFASDGGALVQDPRTKEPVPAFPLVAFLRPAKAVVRSGITLPLILMAVGLFRWSLGFWGYSGYQKPPMHGDFEAQRHWMELTINLPVSHWYFYDLQYWGLDYPPLTAYHSWVLGQIGDHIDSSWFSLHSSRGIEGQSLKVFMRATVLVSEYLIYVPAVVICVRRLARQSGYSAWGGLVPLAAVLMQPATLLIDHGHFQYNTVMLGFVAAMLAAQLRGSPARSCVYFVLALGFKQMALFYAPAVFAYLLGICVFPRIDVQRFLSIAVVTAATFAALYAPFLLGVAYDQTRGIPLPSDHQLPPLLQPLLAILPFGITEESLLYSCLLQLTQSIHRIFPFARGVFEDKVANLWCAIHSSGLHKLDRYDASLLKQGALALTSLAILPSCALIFLRPKRALLPWALASCAWAFFLCSYQVHEKNALLPLLPTTLLLATPRGLEAEVRAWVGLANALGCWTMFPLLRRDGLGVPYAVLTLLWGWLLGVPAWEGLGRPVRIVHLALYVAMGAWHVVEAGVAPPEGMPDLWVVLNAVVGAAGFGLCYLWCTWNLLVKSGVARAPRGEVAVGKKTQ